MAIVGQHTSRHNSLQDADKSIQATLVCVRCKRGNDYDANPVTRKGWTMAILQSRCTVDADSTQIFICHVSGHVANSRSGRKCFDTRLATFAFLPSAISSQFSHHATSVLAVALSYLQVGGRTPTDL